MFSPTPYLCVSYVTLHDISLLFTGFSRLRFQRGLTCTKGFKFGVFIIQYVFFLNIIHDSFDELCFVGYVISCAFVLLVWSLLILGKVVFEVTSCSKRK